jgi:hypothetical protein
MMGPTCRWSLVNGPMKTGPRTTTKTDDAQTKDVYRAGPARRLAQVVGNPQLVRCAMADTFDESS